MGRIILLMDLDSFYASAEEVRKPEIRGQPVVVCVYSGRSRDSGAVGTANYRARELGIKSGMPIAHAKKLARGKDAVFLPADKAYYKEISDRVMSILSEEADAVEEVSIDEAYLDVSKRSAGSWEKAEGIARRIKDRVREQEHLTCSIGVGPNKFIAKMAADYRKPDGLTVVREIEAKDFLKDFPVSKLHGVGPKTAATLKELGIESTEQLASFDTTKLKQVFGERRATYLHEIANGIDESPVEEKEASQYGRIGTLKEDSADLKTVYGKILELSSDVAEKVTKAGIRFRTVSIMVVDSSLKAHTRSQTIQPTGDLAAALPVAKKLLTNFLEENPGVVIRRIGLTVSNFTETSGQKTLEEFQA